MKSGNINFLEPSGPLQACNGTALHFTYAGNTESALKKGSEFKNQNISYWIGTFKHVMLVGMKTMEN